MKVGSVCGCNVRLLPFLGAVPSAEDGVSQPARSVGWCAAAEDGPSNDVFEREPLFCLRAPTRYTKATTTSSEGLRNMLTEMLDFSYKSALHQRLQFDVPMKCFELLGAAWNCLKACKQTWRWVLCVSSRRPQYAPTYSRNSSSTSPSAYQQAWIYTYITWRPPRNRKRERLLESLCTRKPLRWHTCLNVSVFAPLLRGISS